MKIYLTRNIVLGFLFSILIVLGLALTCYFYFTRMTEVTQWASHARKVLFHAEQVRSYASEIETAQKGFGLTGSDLFLGPYESTKKEIMTHVLEMDSLTRDNDQQHDRVVNLRQLVIERIQFSDEVIRVRRESFEKAKDLVLTMRGKELSGSIKEMLNAIQGEENRLITARSLTARTQFTQFVFAFVGLVISMLTILTMLFYTINSNLKSRTQAEEKLKKAELETTKINHELESFTYSVSHDLRAPLRSINGYSQILKEDYSDKLDDEGRRTIDVISRNAKRMGQLIDDLLWFSRLGRQELRRSKINMDELIASVLTELLDQHKGQKIELDVKSVDAAYGDANMIRQVWINLLSNAIKYSGKKEVSKIGVRCMRSEEENEVTYNVQDNGAGFDMQYEHKLFGVFHRLHKLEEFEGTGVGLALVKRIIDRHGGKVWAEAKVNEGATFYFSLPTKY